MEKQDRPVSRAVQIIPGRILNLSKKFQKSVGSDDPTPSSFLHRPGPRGCVIQLSLVKACVKRVMCGDE